MQTQEVRLGPGDELPGTGPCCPSIGNLASLTTNASLSWLLSKTGLRMMRAFQDYYYYQDSTLVRAPGMRMGMERQI